MELLKWEVLYHYLVPWYYLVVIKEKEEEEDSER